MAIKVFDTKDAVPEAQRDAAVEVGGKFVVEDTTAPDVSGLQSALDKERQRAKDEEKARKALEKERDELKRAADARAKGITEDELQKIRDEEAKSRRPIEEERDRLKAENRKLKLWDRAQSLALENGVMKDRWPKAKKDLADRLDLTEDGESIVIKDANGNVTAETAKDFFAKTYRAEAPFFYEGTGTSGSGATGSTAGGAGSSDATARAAAKGKEMAAQQKATAEKNSLAFQ